MLGSIINVYPNIIGVKPIDPKKRSECKLYDRGTRSSAVTLNLTANEKKKDMSVTCV